MFHNQLSRVLFLMSYSAVVVKKGAADVAGLTDDAKPRRLGPKRATAIRKLFNLKNVGELPKAIHMHAGMAAVM